MAGQSLRQLRPADAAELAAAYTRNREYLRPSQPERAEEFFTEAGQRARIEAAEHGFVIVEDGRIAGALAVENVVRGAAQSASIGYWVAESQTGRGLATRAVAEAVAYAFRELGLHRVDASTLVTNAASQRVLEKNGFERIGVARSYLHIDGAWRDHVLFQRIE